MGDGMWFPDGPVADLVVDEPAGPVLDRHDDRWHRGTDGHWRMPGTGWAYTWADLAAAHGPLRQPAGSPA